MGAPVAPTRGAASGGAGAKRDHGRERNGSDQPGTGGHGSLL